MEELICKDNGANFYKADLHTHTPTDPHFTFAEFDSSQNKKEFAEIYVERLLDKGLQIIGVTEHNSVEWVEILQEAAEGTELTIFPGFEITANSGSSGIHLVCLFDPGTSNEDLDDIITRLGLPRGERFFDDNSCKACEKNLKDTINFILENGGLPIAAHTSSDNGMLNDLSGEQRIEAWKNENLLAIELPKSRSYYEKRDCFEGRLIRNELVKYQREDPIACIYSSDGRSLEEIGSKTTHIKLSEVSIEALKTAFLDYESRIRHPEEMADENFSRIVAAEWDGGFLNDFKVHFNRDLNSLIGGKGTGKSTIIEILRYAFDQEPKGEEIKKQHQQILEDVFQSGSKVRVLVEHHSPQPTKYLIERRYKDEPKIYRWENGNKKELEGVSPNKILSNIEFYGQKEILSLSKNNSIQVDLLKRFQNDIKIKELNNEEEEIKDKLEINTQEILKAEEQKADIEELRVEKKTLKETLSRYENAGILKEFSEKRSFMNEEDQFKKVNNKIENITERLNNFKECISFDLNITEIDTEIDFLKTEEELPHKDMLKNIDDSLENLKDNISEKIEDIEEVINQFKENLELKKEKWEEDNEEQEERYQAKLQEYQDEPVNAEKIESTLKGFNEVNNKLKKESDINLGDLYSSRDTFIEELREVRRKRYQELSDAADLINEKLKGIVKVNVEYEGQKSNFFDKISNLKTGAYKEHINNIIDHPEFTPPNFFETLKEGEESLIKRYDITEASAGKLVNEIPLRKKLELQEYEIPPSIEIKLNIGSEEMPNFKNTENLSVGEKCTAILMLILLHKPYPLIIDQPEDDLDNKFVSTDIVPKFREQKGKRQFIIATHDANIPVLGDSELIQVLSADYGKIDLEDCINGSIDNSEIRIPVEDILEGGKEAFMKRKNKYGF